MNNQKLMDELVSRYEDNAMFGKSGKDAGVAYDAGTKSFVIESEDEMHTLPAAFLADHPQGGDELEQNIKAWIRS